MVVSLLRGRVWFGQSYEHIVRKGLFKVILGKLQQKIITNIFLRSDKITKKKTNKFPTDSIWGLNSWRTLKQLFTPLFFWRLNIYERGGELYEFDKFQGQWPAKGKFLHDIFLYLPKSTAVYITITTVRYSVRACSAPLFLLQILEIFVQLRLDVIH